jgi:hypothetical protein
MRVGLELRVVVRELLLEAFLFLILRTIFVREGLVIYLLETKEIVITL